MVSGDRQRSIIIVVFVSSLIFSILLGSVSTIAFKTFADKVLFQNSGTECLEASIKVIRKYFHSIGKPHKNRIICIKNSFHGRTLAAIYASGSKKNHPKPLLLLQTTT